MKPHLVPWKERYAPLIGRRIAALAWLPTPGDTPDLAAELDEPTLGFAGAALIAFDEAGELVLTPRPIDGGHGDGLAFVGLDTWPPYALDRVRASREPPWGLVEDARLTQVELFTAPRVELEQVVGARHLIVAGGRERFFWVATANGDRVRQGDRLWLGAGAEPPNLAQLQLLTTIGR